LAAFTGAVKGIVETHSGFLIYAGGDDVLAVLPLEDAMDCALALRRRYMAGFAAEIDAATAAGKLPTDKRFQATLSGAIEYAHIRMPLTKVLKDAHGLLDGVAKEGRGRDALAVRVWKPGGKAIEWAMPWEIALEDDPAQELAKRRLAIQVAAEDLGEDDTDGQLSSRFFYRIRERFDLLNPKDRRTKPVFPPDGEEALHLMAAEYLSSGLCDKLPAAQRMEHAKSVVRPLLRQCRPVTRDAGVSDPSRWKRHKQIQADGALLVRFLAQKGVER
jgi:CRISPR-associated protein Cmr2